MSVYNRMLTVLLIDLMMTAMMTAVMSTKDTMMSIVVRWYVMWIVVVRIDYNNRRHVTTDDVSVLVDDDLRLVVRIDVDGHMMWVVVSTMVSTVMQSLQVRRCELLSSVIRSLAQQCRTITTRTTVDTMVDTTTHIMCPSTSIRTTSRRSSSTSTDTSSVVTCRQLL